MPKRTKTDNLVSRTLRVNNTRHFRLVFPGIIWGAANDSFAIHGGDSNNPGQLGPILYDNGTGDLTLTELEQDILNNPNFAWATKVEAIIGLTEGEPELIIDITGDQRSLLIEEQITFLQTETEEPEGSGNLTTGSGIIFPKNCGCFIEVSVPEHISLSAQSLVGQFISFPETPDGFVEKFDPFAIGGQQIENTSWVPAQTLFNKPESHDTEHVYLPSTFLVPPGSDVEFHILTHRDTKWMKTQVWQPPQRVVLPPFDPNHGSGGSPSFDPNAFDEFGNPI